MTFAERVLIAFAVAALTAYLATPRAIALAHRLQFYDKPAGYKGHARATPYLGGAAVMAAFFLAVALTAGHWSMTAPLLGAAALMWVVGTVDDRRTVSPALRVLIEAALGVLVWATGLGWHLHAGGAVDLALTCMWVLGVVNAFNLFDNMDGAAGTMALVVCAGAALIGVVRGEVWLAAASASLCGACFGFLPRNISVPARIFLGDGGSMPVGFVVATLVMVAAGTSGVAWRSLVVALLLVGIPVLDTSLVIVSRRRRGISVLTGGRDHLTHRALRLLPNPRAVALSLGAIQAALSVLAVLASRGEALLVALSATVYLLAAGIAIVVLDTQQIEEFPVPERRSLSWANRADAVLVVLGLGAGASPFFFTYYDSSVWVPIGLGVTLVCAIAVVLRMPRLSGPAPLAIAGLLGLGLLSLISASWAESVEGAIVSGNRWLVYGAVLLLALTLVRRERGGAIALGAAAVGIAAVAASVLVRMLGSDPGTLFLGGRLNAPLGYINGEGCLFAMGLWPCIALAETRRAAFAGVGAASATLLACLALLSQSRGTALAILGSLIVVAALAPGRTRRIYAALLVGAGVALAGHDLLAIYRDAAGGQVSSASAHAAARAALLAALAVGLVWAALTRAGARSAASLPRAARATSWLLALPALAAIVIAAASVHRIEHSASRQWRAFVHLAEPGEGRAPASAVNTRLLTGAGNRYDYWRIAVDLFDEHTLEGVGAGNYARYYYERRATTEDVDQPHSLELGVLSDLGLPGALLLAMFIAGSFWGAARLARQADASPTRRGVLVCALGVFTAWLVQASVDWMALLPGLTAIALLGAAALTWPERSALAPERVRLRDRVPAPAAAAVSLIMLALIVAGASLSREGLAEVYRSRAEGELARRPSAALRDARRSLKLDANAPHAYYVKAAALARFDEASASEAALGAALEREPRNFVTWALLGDLALRQRRVALAQRDYLVAHQLNPRDRTLTQLARNPRSALR